MPYIVIFSYLIVTLAIGAYFRTRVSGGNVEFFLAGRSLRPLILFFTMAATNFSAFTIFGLSGAGYRIGYAFYPVMGFGTGFMALTFMLIGKRILRLSRSRDYITPSDFISDRYGSGLLRTVFSLILVIFTLPYIAIQTIAAGRLLQELTGTPYIAGALLVTIFICLYVTFGGLRSIAWTDLLQGSMMVVLTLIAYILIVRGAGGFVSLHESLLQSHPDHLSRPGAGNAFPPGIWTGYLVLWFFADPMFPQLFQRFMAARDEKALELTAVLYPLITTSLFFLTVSIGVMGRLVLPDLPVGETDSIFPMLVREFAGPLLGSLLLAGSVAALMSTLDSQLLTVSSIVTRDILRVKASDREGGSDRRLGRPVTIAVAVVGFLVAVNPPETILDFVGRTTFNGLSVLAPAVAGGLYWKRGNRYGALASIFTGELLVLLFYFGLLETPGVLPVLPIAAAATLVYVLVSLLTRAEENVELVSPVERGVLPWAMLFGLLFVLGNDFWNWNRVPVLRAGLPGWLWYFMLLGILTSLVFAAYAVRSNRLPSRNEVPGPAAPDGR